MAIPTDLAGILSGFELPAGAGVLAYWLVKGAGAIEADMREERRKDISDLLKEHSFTSLGRLGGSIVPFVFEKIFGSKVLGFKFVTRSILASILFWVVLLGVKHARVSVIFHDITTFTWPFIPVILFVDWLSLAKSKLIISVMAKRVTFYWNAIFLVCDVGATLLLLMVAAYLSVFMVLLVAEYDSNIVLFVGWIRLSSRYLQVSDVHSLSQVWAPSTMLTSAWVVLLVVSTILLKLLAQLEYVRRFTIWWFDVDEHPLRAIAEVAATLVVIGAIALKAGRWVLMMV
jgi:hypothetical protein